MVAYVLIIVGALNWGLIGLLDLNLVDALLGSWPGLERLVYILVGASALLSVAKHRMECKVCGGEMYSSKSM